MMVINIPSEHAVAMSMNEIHNQPRCVQNEVVFAPNETISVRLVTRADVPHTSQIRFGKVTNL